MLTSSLISSSALTSWATGLACESTGACPIFSSGFIKSVLVLELFTVEVLANVEASRASAFVDSACRNLYGTALYTCLGRFQIEEGQALLEEMKRAGIEPTAEMVTHMEEATLLAIQHAERGDEWEEDELEKVEEGGGNAETGSTELGGMTGTGHSDDQLGSGSQPGKSNGVAAGPLSSTILTTETE